MFILPTLPYPLNDGFNLRYYNIGRSLKKNGHKIFLVHLEKGKTKRIAKIEEKLKREIFEDIISINKYKLNTLEYICECVYKFTNINYFSNLKRNSTHEQILKILYKKYNFDIIHYGGHRIPFLLGMVNSYPKLIDLGDSITLFFKRKIPTISSPIKIISNSLDYIYNKRIEKLIVKNWNHISVVSQKDKNMLDSFNRRGKVFVIPNGVDGNYFSPNGSKKNEESTSILFHGSMYFDPNIKAVEYIINEIIPLIKIKVPNLKFYIVGQKPSSEIVNFGKRDDIIVTGFVKDIRKYISMVDVIVEPMISGSGIKNKILEGMAMQKPVVTNPMGAEALNLNAYKCLLIGKNNFELANHIINLLKDKELRQKLGEKGRKIILNDYDWNKITKKYENLYKKIISEFN